MVPFMAEYCQLLVADPEAFASISDIWLNFKAYVLEQGSELSPVATPRRFQRQLAALSYSHPWQKLTKTVDGVSQRGYCVWLPRTSRRQQAAEPRPPGQLYTVLFINKRKGNGAFSSVSIPSGTIVECFRGSFFHGTEEMERREAVYKREGLPPTLISLGAQQFFDAYVDSEGARIPLASNPAVMFNHSCKRPCCKLVKLSRPDGDTIGIRTLRKIAIGEELCFAYGDRRRGLESWLRDS